MIELKNGKNELNELLKNNNKCLIDFYTVWCGPCKMLGLELQKFEKLHPEWTIIRVDAEKFPDIFGQLGVDGVPTICIAQNQNIKEVQVGYRPLSELEKIINKY